MGKTILYIGIGILLLSFCWASSSIALNNAEVFSQFQFNYITPGARATAMGGAFIGLADDATAVESNPAGLLKLYEPEFSLEFKHIAYTTDQFYKNIRLGQSIQREEFKDSVNSIPFISVVYPFGAQKKMVVSFYRQKSVLYKSSYRTGSDIIIIPFQELGLRPPGQGITIPVLLPVDAAIDLAVTNYGIGFAVELFEGFSVAATPKWSLMKMESHYAQFFAKGAPTRFTDDEVFFEYQISDEDHDFGLNIGAIWEITPEVSVGMVYRKGNLFTATLEEGRGNTALIDSDEAEFTLNLPYSFGVGIAVRAFDTARSRLQFTVDALHIHYESLLDDFDIIKGGDESIRADDYAIDNATELHLGMEYAYKFDSVRSLMFRVGMYNEPDHIIEYTGPYVTSREAFPGGSDDVHITGGIGIVLTKHMQCDSAVNFSSNNMQFSLSSVYKF
ncbi:MAG: hypothetical protein JXI43_09530 [Tissierellales bacterium]|nr:hypothetical protein [Tissierellales bacterium]